MDFQEAFEKYIKGQKIQSEISVRKDYSDTTGIILENGYKYTTHGGGCGGEDINHTYIFSPDGELVATSEEW